MKRVLYFILFISLTLMRSSDFAQKTEESIVKEIVVKLFSYCKEKSFDNAAKLIAYTGEDKNREFKTSYNSNNKDELNQVKRICKKISALLELSNKYEFGKFYVTKEGNLDIYCAEIIFISGEEKLTTTFKFTKTPAGYLLINLN